MNRNPTYGHFRKFHFDEVKIKQLWLHALDLLYAAAKDSKISKLLAIAYLFQMTEIHVGSRKYMKIWIIYQSLRNTLKWFVNLNFPHKNQQLWQRSGHKLTAAFYVGNNWTLQRRVADNAAVFSSFNFGFDLIGEDKVIYFGSQRNKFHTHSISWIIYSLHWRLPVIATVKTVKVPATDHPLLFFPFGKRH